MPTSKEYRVAAGHFKTALWRSVGAFQKLDAGWDDVVVGGPLKQLVERAVDASVANIRTVWRAYGDLHDECIRRAGVCESYDQAIVEYNMEMADNVNRVDNADWSPPPQPQPPHSWVEASEAIRY